MKSAFVCSGGGAKGSYGAGLAQYLVEQKGMKYDILTGTSTGSMMIPLIAVEDFTTLKTAYTSIVPSDIFKVNPFKANAPDMELNYAAIIYNMAIRGQKTFGDSSNIIATINKFFTEAVYDRIKSSGKHVVACVSNLTKEQVEYYDAFDCSYADILDWVRASGSFTPFMSIVDKNGNQYCDGGVYVPLPIQRAIDLGAEYIDAIVLDTPTPVVAPQTSKNAFQLLARMMDCMSAQLFTDDEYLGSLEAREKDVTLNVYYTPTVLTNNSLQFNKADMLRWYDAGYSFAANNKPQTQIVIKAPAQIQTRHNLEGGNSGLKLFV